MDRWMDRWGRRGYLGRTLGAQEWTRPVQSKQAEPEPRYCRQRRGGARTRALNRTAAQPAADRRA
jgi:hypothetical protein